MIKFNNLLSAIIDADDLESEASSCDPANSTSSSSSTTSSSSSTKKASQSQDNQQKDMNLTENIDKSPTDSNSNLDDNQLSTSLNSLSTDASSTKNEDNMSSSNEDKLLLLETSSVTKDNNGYELDITQEVESVLNGIIDEVVENQSKTRLNLVLVDELLVKLDSKLEELRAFYIELNEFYEQIQNYQNLLNRLKLNTKSTDTSNASLIIDDLLQYLDFLNDSDETTDKQETKELKINLPDDFFLFLSNCLSQANCLIDVCI